MASDLPAPESKAPRPGAVTGGHGSNPEPTAHTCTTSERSAVAESGQKEKKRKREISPPKFFFKKPLFQHFIQIIWNWLNLLHAVTAQRCHWPLIQCAPQDLKSVALKHPLSAGVIYMQDESLKQECTHIFYPLLNGVRAPFRRECLLHYKHFADSKTPLSFMSPCALNYAN